MQCVTMCDWLSLNHKVFRLLANQYSHSKVTNQKGKCQKLA